MTEDIYENIYTDFHKRFANGEQYLDIDEKGEIVEISKNYFWEEKGVYNKILPIIEMLKKKISADKLTDEYLYGKNGLVSLLVPIQRAYNSLMNRSAELTNQIVFSNLLVEDGSVDTDNLQEEGIGPGKIIVYRQGAQKPEHFYREGLTDATFFLESRRKILLEEFNSVVNLYLGEQESKIGFYETENSAKKENK